MLSEGCILSVGRWSLTGFRISLLTYTQLFLLSSGQSDSMLPDFWLDSNENVKSYINQLVNFIFLQLVLS